MDSSLYKKSTTSRGLSYNYYFSKPAAGKPTLLFLHGFPSTSYDWRYQVALFQSRNYGIIVPDLLGYGGTDKPSDPALYAVTLIAKDVIDVLDAEGISDRVIAVGHDWGSKVASRLANLYTDRFVAFAFFAVSYIAPNPLLPYDTLKEHVKKAFGREVFGYWEFFSDEDAVALCEKNFDSFFSLLFAKDSSLWVPNVTETGATRAWIESNKHTDIASYLSEEEIKNHKHALLSNGLAGPFTWFKVLTSTVDLEDSKTIPQEKYPVSKPTFFGACKQDLVAMAPVGQATMEQFCSSAVIKEYDAAHWVILEAKDQVNSDLAAWVEQVSK
ncbi:Alpha/Beta hydrolase protein [Cyathus striatus]|nr:Alpha/Beta hydrolase protein [Cyathus striatus]